MKLKTLLQSLEKAVISGDQTLDVSGVTADSREVSEGSVYVAIRGTAVDGNDFVKQAIDAGAVAIISEVAPDADWDGKICWAHVGDARAAVAALACAWYENPSSQLQTIGITGTNGKTTTAFIAHAILKNVQHRAGLLGTIKVDNGLEEREATHTTPDPLQLQQVFSEMVENGCRAVAMEVSSHALHQKRTAGTSFDVGVFTNLSQDHLDYHVSMEAYFNAKKLMFESMVASESKKRPTAVINIDERHGELLVRDYKDDLRILTFGFSVHADFRAVNVKQGMSGTQFELQYKGKDYLVKTPYFGLYNVSNALAALTSTIAIGVPIREAIKAIADAPQVPGRLESLGRRDGTLVFVDYAHTPDAIANVCNALKEIDLGRLITVFGCGGDRDETKRPLMGKVASELSDYCVITSDNPRTEDPNEIIKQIVAGVKGTKYEVVPHRGIAIQKAVNMTRAGDVVLLAGKGHETYQDIAGHKVHFDDRVEGRKAMAARNKRIEDARAVKNAEMEKKRQIREQIQAREEREEKYGFRSFGDAQPRKFIPKDKRDDDAKPEK
ncbi:UDP-N-acetylmuramoyl-L-alanyl-D-glutamate--2,6-diaminopimelate ligase [Persicirhabdus sediminis]|uniref:UDP-N-acetylmuramoyl-L-alanyl-D-glutamate--2,6-diaminopimelate ligase n=1 Tax=Persicirhabdus sediminis TaxID=454144 RepID=A0A8J7SHE9_9BACT|nr:UDP-N-acetylmuramoyl-L-alanyl-D-glutamate--2,6-diaminopimelate ligase [Persicirhabdus sediminis]MBK1789794.1 UDP-N-acetylmuramoyl-L-alanyl-D-glutamate--2,6-diaminopimelate ligase [Persicirhabdus sediminis]